MPKYTFDVLIATSLTVEADTAEAGAKILTSRLGCDANFGSFENGDPIVGPVYLQRDVALEKIDGEDIDPDSDQSWIAAAIAGHVEFNAPDASNKYWTARDSEEESWIVDHTYRCKTKAECARVYCEDRGCEPV